MFDFPKAKPSASRPRSAPDDRLAEAAVAQQRGELQKAEALCKAVLRKDAANVTALGLLGAIKAVRGDFSKAETVLARAIAIDPGSAEAHRNRGVALEHLGRPDDALACYDRALALAPRDAIAHFNRGVVLAKLKRLDEALHSYEAALAFDGQYVDALVNRGNIFAAMGRPKDALLSYRKAIGLRPDYAELHFNSGHELQRLKRFPEAIASYDRALAISPGYAEAWLSRGNAFQAQKQHDQAMQSYGRALALKPDYATAYCNLGNTLQHLKKFHEAMACYDRSLVIDGAVAEVHYNRGMALCHIEHFDEALASFDRAIALNRDYAMAFLGKAALYYGIGELSQALANYELASAARARAGSSAYRNTEAGSESLERLDYLPGYRCDAKRLICDWTDFTAEHAQLIEAVRKGTAGCPPFAMLAIATSPADCLAAAKSFAATNFPPIESPIWRGDLYGHDKIRVAYLSGDFRNKPMPHLLAGLFEQHDRSVVDPVALSFKSDPNSDMQARLRNLFELFIDVDQRTDLEVAELLRAMEIDIVVDLMGYAGDIRTGILAMRPAPIQVSYMGFPGSMGVSYVDYLIADSVVIPPEEHGFYSEKIVNLPDTYYGTDDQLAIADETPSRRDAGLPEHGFVFCCFNANYKITPETFDIWMRLLRSIDGSLIWLVESNVWARENLCREAQARGIQPDRLVFARKVDPARHLARHRLADLFLDTLPYNAHTTATDALWAGLPLVTRIGTTFPGRVAASVLHSLGLPELITNTAEEYEALAIDLARNPSRLSAIKAKLARHRTTYPLFNTSRFTRHLEVAYKTMWQRYIEGEPASHFAVAPID